MREKLIEYVRNLFRNAPNNPHNRDLEAEILQNSLDRFDDLVSKGVSEESAYSQAVDSIGDVRQLWEYDGQPQAEPVKPKKKRAGWIIGGVCAVLALILAGSLAVGWRMGTSGGFGRNRGGEDWEDRIENWVDGLERDADHWANDLETTVEQWVEKIDEEYGYSVILPNSTYDFSDSERFTAGPAEVQADSLDKVIISWISGEVTVETWDGETVSITETGAEKESEQVHWLLEDGELRINYCAAGKHETLPAKKLVVRLPAGLAKKLQYLNIGGTSQDAIVSGLETKQLGFYSTSGGLHYTGNAKIVELETTSGEFELFLGETPGNLNFDSVSGGLKLAIPGERSFEADWDTVSGSFDCAFDTRTSDGEFLYTAESRTSTAEFEFDTVSGDVAIEKS